MSVHEWNFDSLVGPTHNYAGLSAGNVASEKNAGEVSRPRDAALEGIAKMRLVASLGVKQAVLPPQPRPDLHFLRTLGFDGTDANVLKEAHRHAPWALRAAWSASSMWAANAATVAPSSDTADHKVHFTPANLSSNLHRTLEGEHTTHTLRQIFADAETFVVHEPLPNAPWYSDEGAANHTRLCAQHSVNGAHILVYSKSHQHPSPTSTAPARQCLEACEAIARLHQLDPDRVAYVRQDPNVIDQGVFHNDVIGVGNENVLLMHERAFAEPQRAITDIERALGSELVIVRITEDELSVADAVRTYLFNSQLLTLPTSSSQHTSMALLAPKDVEEHPAARRVAESLPKRTGGLVSEVVYADVRQSMRNGGGPACLRLRVPLSTNEANAMHQGVIFTDALANQLEAVVREIYPQELRAADLFSTENAHRCAAAQQAVLEALSLR